MDGADLGRALRARRAAAGRTIADVATQAGLSVPYVANLENGRGNPTVSALTNLGRALDAPLTVTLGERQPGDLPDLPGSLVRFARTARFDAEVDRLAATNHLPAAELRRRLTAAMATIASVAPHEPTELDWHRVLDAIVLITVRR